MPTSTYVPLGTVTLTASASEIEFSSIPSYSSLVLVLSAKSTSGSYDQGLQLNGDTGSNYNNTILYGNGSTGSSTTINGTTQFYLDYYGSVTNTFSTSTVVQIEAADSTTHRKIMHSRSNRDSSGLDFIGGEWTDSGNAVTTLTYFLISGTLDSGTTASLYGID